MAREGLDVSGTGRNKSENGPGEGRDGNRRNPRRQSNRPRDRSILERAGDAMTPTGRDPGALRALPGIGTAISAGTELSARARAAGLEVVDPMNNPDDPRGRPGLGRDAQQGERLRLQRAAAAGGSRLTPSAGDTPVTGGADEDAGDGGSLGNRRTVIGPANVRRPVLTSRLGATFLGRG